MNYFNEEKHKWRRKIWDSIISLLSVPPCKANVFYLAGEQDLDRPVATGKGFTHENMIAIERDSKVVEKLRSKGVTAICADLEEIIRYWTGPEIHVVYADMCCGYTDKIDDILKALIMNPNFTNSVLMFNLMRGRDKSKNDFKNSCIFGKHRAESAVIGQMMGADWCIKGDAARIKEWSESRLIGWQAFSYLSTSGQVFDSACWKNLGADAFHLYYCNKGIECRKKMVELTNEIRQINPLEQEVNYDKDIAAFEDLIQEINDSKEKANQLIRKSSPRHIKNKIAALKAVRTSRIQAA